MTVPLGTQVPPVGGTVAIAIIALSPLFIYGLWPTVKRWFGGESHD